MGIYEELGVKRIINALGTSTMLGGSVLDKDVIDAIADAATSFVNMKELEEKAGKIIAEITGAEAAYVTSGAFAGLVLAVAACMIREDISKSLQLPDTTGMRNEVIVQKPQRNYYDSFIRIAGAKLIEVGKDNIVNPEDIEAAINDRTAAILYFEFSPQEGIIPIEKVVKIAHNYDVPVIVDAAAELPPVENLRKFIDIGADIVVFSGGKDIGAPNDTGIVFGKRKWIDIIVTLGPYYDYTLGKAPIGRGAKVSKEDIVALIVALRKYIKIDHKARLKSFEEKVDWMVNELKSLPSLHVNKIFPKLGHPRPLIIPRVEIILDKERTKLSTDKVIKMLEDGNPSIVVYKVEDKIYINPQCLKDGEEKIIVNKLREILSASF